MSNYGKRVRRLRKHSTGKRLFEKLEPRQMLAADLLFQTQPLENATKAPPEPTVFYQAGDTEIGLSVLSNKVAISIAPERTSALPSEWTFERQLNGNLSVFSLSSQTVETRSTTVEDLSRIDGVEFVVPVFFSADAQAELVAANELIISLDASVTPEDYFGASDIFADFRSLRGSADQFVATLAGGFGSATIDAANSALKERGVAWATPNFYFDVEKFYTPNDPRFANQWHLENTGQGGGLVGADANLTEAWDVNPGGTSEIVIGVIDDAVDFHEDLLLFVNAGEVPNNGIDDDGNGWIDDVNGWNFVADNNISTPTNPDDVHGTAVAGVAAARGDNNLGVTGAAYRSMVISARIFEGAGVASEAGIAEALRYMAGFTADGTGTWRSADIVNNSWGGGGVSAAINSALADGTTTGRQGKGTPYFFASGNGFSGSLSQPAAQAANIPGVFAIGATNNLGERSDYSNFGTGLDFVAPSNDTRAGYLAIDTTDREGTAGYNTALNGNYTGNGATGFGGTSSATPLAAGIAALTLAELESNGLEFSPTTLRDYMRANTDLLGGVEYDPATGWNPEFGFGRIDAGAALQNIGKAELSVLSSTEDLVSGVSVVELGSAIVGNTTSQATLRIRNQGTQPLSLLGLTVSSGPFSIASGPGSNTLEVGEATTFVIGFDPTNAGLATGTATITSNDADEALFVLDLTGIGLVASVSGVTFEDHNADGLRTSNEAHVGGSIAYLDLNNNGQRDVVVESFETTTPVNILDGIEVFSPLVVSGAQEGATTILVEVDIAHTFVSDLDIILISPNGTEVVLASDVGGAGANFSGTVFDDNASISIADGSAPFTGSFIPLQPLSGLLDSELDGTWQLSVEDFFLFDEGQILGWSITFASSEPSLQTDENGSYAFFNLQNGDYVLRNEAPTGWAESTATAYEFTINDEADAFPGSNFGIGKDNRFYGLAYNDDNANGTQDSDEAELPNWTIFQDTNSNGLLDTAIVTSLSNTNSVAIADNTVVTSNITASDLNGAVLDVNVQLNITHTFTGDLDVFLVAPNGSRVELFTDVGGSGDNFVDTILDDEASASITTGTAPFTGTFRPEGALSDFDGIAANGTWRLEVGDDAGGDIGTLNSWTLILTTGERAHTTSNFGEAIFDLPVGNHRVGLVLENDWEYTFPLDGFIDASAGGAPLYAQNFGVREIELSVVTTRGIFYNNATGSNLGSGGDAAGALDPTKQPLLPGETSTFSNYSNYQRGLNGFLFDITGLANGATEQEILDSLQFSIWNGIDVAGFVALPAEAVPSVELVTMNDATRVKVSFPDGSLMNTWLQTVVLANETTNLAIDDIFYFGHVLGDVGQGNNSTRIRVNAVDTIFIRANQSVAANSADVSNPYDLNRDGRVNAIDTIIVRANQQIAGIVAPLNAPSRSKANISSKGNGAFGKAINVGSAVDLGSIARLSDLQRDASSMSNDQSRSDVAKAPVAMRENSSSQITAATTSRLTMPRSSEQLNVVRDRGIPSSADRNSVSNDKVFEMIGTGSLSFQVEPPVKSRRT